MGDLGVTVVAGDSFKFFGDATVELVHASALAADDVVMVAVRAGVGEAIKALPAFERVALDNSRFEEGEDAAVNGHEVSHAGREGLVKSLDGHRAGRGGEGVEHGLSRFCDTQGGFVQAGDGDFVVSGGGVVVGVQVVVRAHRK
jgi:hypothetical protein